MGAKVVHDTVEMAKPTSAGEEVYVDEDEIHLGRPGSSTHVGSALLAAALPVAKKVEEGAISEVRIDDLVFSHRSDGRNSLVVAAPDGLAQNTNTDALQDAVDLVRDN